MSQMSGVPLNVIDLIRVSSDRQDVSRQRSDMQAVHRTFNAAAVRVLELHGVSGTATLDDEQVQQVLRDLERPDIAGIAISSLDRLFRPGKRYGQFAILDRFVDAGKVIYSKREGLIDPATDEGYDKCLSAGGRAGAEWRELRRRSSDGRRERLGEGKLDHGTACYAYLYIPKHQENGQRLVIDTGMSSNPGLSKVDVVRMVFRMRMQGLSIFRIAYQLNTQGILTDGRIYRNRPDRSKPPGRWQRQTIHQMLRNPTYKGEHRRAGQTIPCEAIIDPETWDAVQRLNAESKRRHVGRPPKFQYLLRTFLWCAKCERRYLTVYRGDGRRKYYRCGNIDWTPARFKPRCDALAIEGTLIERTVWSAIWAMLTTPRILMSAARAYQSETAPAPDRRAALEAEIEQLRADEQHYQEMARHRIWTLEKASTEIAALRERRETLERELKSLGRVVELPGERALLALAREISSSGEPGEYAEQRNVLEHIRGLRIAYSSDRQEVTIRGEVPVGEPAARGRGGNCNKRVDGYYNSIPFVLIKKVVA